MWAMRVVAIGRSASIQNMRERLGALTLLLAETLLGGTNGEELVLEATKGDE